MNESLASAVIFLIPIAGIIAIFTFLAVVGWAKERRREREAFYRHETARKLVERGEMNAEQFRTFVEEEALRPLVARREALKLGGLVLLLLGIGMLVGFMEVSDEPVRGIGWMPFGIGLALLVYAYLLAPRAGARPPR
jgi:hypothetical protein